MTMRVTAMDRLATNAGRQGMSSARVAPRTRIQLFGRAAEGDLTKVAFGMAAGVL
jgi:hypothetical protein